MRPAKRKAVDGLASATAEQRGPSIATERRTVHPKKRCPTYDSKHFACFCGEPYKEKVLGRELVFCSVSGCGMQWHRGCEVLRLRASSASAEPYCGDPICTACVETTLVGPTISDDQWPSLVAGARQAEQDRHRNAEPLTNESYTIEAYLAWRAWQWTGEKYLCSDPHCCSADGSEPPKHRAGKVMETTIEVDGVDVIEQYKIKWVGYDKPSWEPHKLEDVANDIVPDLHNFIGFKVATLFFINDGAGRPRLEWHEGRIVNYCKGTNGGQFVSDAMWTIRYSDGDEHQVELKDRSPKGLPKGHVHRLLYQGGWCLATTSDVARLESELDETGGRVY